MDSLDDLPNILASITSDSQYVADVQAAGASSNREPSFEPSELFT